MSYFAQDLSLSVDGVVLDSGMRSDNPLVRAVNICLFTWRRALPDDPLPGNDRMGWWGDSYADVAGDRIGSRLWLLARETITPRTVERARQYAQEALAVLVEDGVATRIDVFVERLGMDGLAITCRIHRADGTSVVLRYDDVWSFLKNA